MSDGIIALVLVHHREAFVFVGHVIAAHLEQRTHSVTDVIPENRASIFANTSQPYLVFCVIPFTLTSDDQVCIWEKALSLHQRSGVARVENVKDAICIHPHRSVSWEETQQTVLNRKRGDHLSEIKKRCCDLFSPSKNESKTWVNLLIWYWPQLLHRSVLCKGSPENTRTQEADPFFIFPHCLFCSCEEALRRGRGRGA